MTKHDKLRRGETIFKCDVCGRGTRQTDRQALGSKLCGECWDLAGLENELSDRNSTREELAEEIETLVAAVKAKGGDITEWVKAFNLKEVL